ncbi:hypothetical protein [Bosea sp. UNC402CLCol]|uniref:hypothetical protein n=1 Tax=Bosea sp. UNC402CLCol TaxID=1510531 RepID=UPI00068A4727|nr:hypothetical protein [Bosea sp. UNC402CLCol]
MATIRKLRGRWQAQVRRRGMAPRAKSFDQKADAEKWARSLESELDRCGMLPDTRVAESTTLRSILERYMVEVSPRKRSAHTETSRIKALLRRTICHRTLTLLSPSDLATYRDERLKTASPSTIIRELNTIFEKGLNVIEVSTISGHKELRMLSRYAHLRATDLVVRLG